MIFKKRNGPMNKETSFRKKSRLNYAIIIGVVIFIIYLSLVLLLIFNFGDLINAGGGRKIALINIKGPIAASGSEGFFSSAVTPELVIDQLKLAAEDDDIKAVLLRVNSPGGTSSAGQEIYMQVKKLRKKKPIIVSIADVGASAAYLISSPATKIMATESSLVGSIGTIIVVPNYEGLFGKIGIDYTIISQGKFKDMGDPSRALTEEEKEILTKQSKEVYDQFIDDVAEARGLKRSKVKKLATGQAFLGSEGIENGLIDEIGNYQDAIDLAAKLGKIKGEPDIVQFDQTSFFQTFSQFLSNETLRLKKDLAEVLRGSQTIEPIR